MIGRKRWIMKLCIHLPRYMEREECDIVKDGRTRHQTWNGITGCPWSGSGWLKGIDRRVAIPEYVTYKIL